MSEKESLLVTWKVLRLLVNTFTANDKYPFLSSDNSMQTIQMHLFQKQKTLFTSFLCIFQIYIKFTTFSKKCDSHSLCISEITDPERRGYKNV